MREATGRKESGNDPGTFSSGLDSTCWGRWCCRCRWFDGSCRGSLTGSLTGSSWTGQRILKDSWRDLCGLITGFWRIPDRIFGSLRILIILILFLDHCEPICKDPSTALRNQDPSNPIQSREMAVVATDPARILWARPQHSAERRERKRNKKEEGSDTLTWQMAHRLLMTIQKTGSF